MSAQGAQPSPAESAPAETPKGPGLPEKAVKGSWNLITGVVGFFGRRIKGVTKAGWEATGGQVTGEMREVGKRVGFESKEEGLFNQIGEIISVTSNKIANLLGGTIGGTIKYGVGLPGRIVQRTCKAAQYAWNTIFGINNSGPSAGSTESPKHA